MNLMSESAQEMKPRSSISPKVCVIQDGARRNYMVPLALQEIGILDRVFTDWYAEDRSITKGFSQLVRRFDKIRGQKMLDRHRAGLDGRRILSCPLLALRCELARNQFSSSEEYFEWFSLKFARWVRSKGMGESNSVYGYIRNVHPRLWDFASSKGLHTVGDQMIAPSAVERREFHLQQERWPGWETNPTNCIWELVDQMERESWDLLDHIICGSDYVKDGLIAEGVESSKVSVTPYLPSGAGFPFVERKWDPKPTIVGFTGAVGLRKGAPYFLEVAKHFDPKLVKFVMVGKIGLDKQVLEGNLGNVELTGAVPRSQIQSWLNRFDIFFFPSTCEGCAGSVVEAMDTGLPIVTTRNSGTIVRDGVEGFVRDYTDISGFVDAIQKLVDDPELRHRTGVASRLRNDQFTLDSYSTNLGSLFSSLLQKGRI
jgi:glycosyltransferase involved in cell wall biosynthesis